jgi:hypothetical protein
MMGTFVAKVVFTLLVPGYIALAPYIYAMLKWNDTARRWITTSDSSFWQIAAMALASGLIADAVASMAAAARKRPTEGHYLTAAVENVEVALYLGIGGLVWRFYDAPVHLAATLTVWAVGVVATRRILRSVQTASNK